jgi:hypothetical protein
MGEPEASAGVPRALRESHALVMDQRRADCEAAQKWAQEEVPRQPTAHELALAFIRSADLSPEQLQAISTEVGRRTSHPSDIRGKW